MSNNRFFTLETENRKQFFQIPKQFMNKKSKYFKMDTDTKLLYGILSDKNSLSISNGWVDDKNNIYFISTIECLMELLGWGKNKVINKLKELREYELLITVAKGQGKPSWHYLLQIEVEEHLESQSYQQKFENETSTSDITKPLEVSKSNPNNNNINNNNINNTKEKREDKYTTSLTFSTLAEDEIENEDEQTIIPDDADLDKHVKNLLQKDKAFKGVNFNNPDCYMPFIESIVLTQIQDNIEILGYPQWAYFRQTLLNKMQLLLKNKALLEG